MKFYSHKYYEKMIQPFNKEIFFNFSKRKIHHITILSTHNTNTIMKDRLFKLIPKEVRKLCKIKLIFSSFDGFRLSCQRKELLELQTSLYNLGYNEIKIFLNYDIPTFCTKLYYFEDENEDKSFWLISSVDIFSPMFDQSEGILLKLNGDYNNIFLPYIDKILKHSTLINRFNKPTINSIIKFWRTGVLYYKPNANIQFTFSRLRIPEWVLKILMNDLDPPAGTEYSEPWGPFNIKIALEIEIEKEGTQVRHKPWSIETCFGYWVPFKYKEPLDNKIADVIKTNKSNYNYVLERMEALEEYLYEQFDTYIQEVESALKSIYHSYLWEVDERIVVKFDEKFFIGTVTQVGDTIHIKLDNGLNIEMGIVSQDKDIIGVGKNRKSMNHIPNKQLSKWLIKEFWYPPENINEQFKKFVEKLFKKLRNEQYVERASSPLIPTTMPELWFDTVALDEFSQSFYEYIASRVNIPSKPKIIKSLQKKCNFENIDDYWEDIKEIIEDYINENGWTDENWKD